MERLLFPGPTFQINSQWHLLPSLFRRWGHTKYFWTWKRKMWVTHPESPRTCIIALSTFPSPLEKLELFVASFYLSSSCLLDSWQKEFLLSFYRQDSCCLKLQLYFISLIFCTPSISTDHAVTISYYSLFKTRMFPAAWSFAQRLRGSTSGTYLFLTLQWTECRSSTKTLAWIAYLIFIFPYLCWRKLPK